MSVMPPLRAGAPAREFPWSCAIGVSGGFSDGKSAAGMPPEMIVRLVTRNEPERRNE